jgi:hypothetical protein
VVHIAGPVVHLRTGAVAAVSLDMKIGREISIRPDVRLRCAASRVGDSKPAPIALITPLARLFRVYIAKKDISMENTGNQLNLSDKMDMTAF